MPAILKLALILWMSTCSYLHQWVYAYPCLLPWPLQTTGICHGIEATTLRILQDCLHSEDGGAEHA